jgi:hypothetical protein
METSSGIFLTQLCLKRIMGADITPLITFDIIHLLHAGEGNMNKYSHFLYPHAINVLLYRMKPRKHISSSDNKSVSHWIMFDYFFHV